ncbi:uncharacterized protein PV06_06090 [Exophiala oligosperma]|uniref:Uncharacterized protein n=2 Tax=Chaetothyriales TaxID=34395 RepID=A0A0D2DJF0_9EURO|nr:uncharacterized protein PV06_06090 [Exophiala oligosperma]KAJ9622951.1 hypothetical protein H2204_011295 [Knufia peltigerae]KIW42550.1 hypothetical protein PV06_06090 [Exophiala oligosperma]
MDSQTENNQSTRPVEMTTDNVVSEQPTAAPSMNPTQPPTKLGLRGGGEGEDVCCGL